MEKEKKKSSLNFGEIGKRLKSMEKDSIIEKAVLGEELLIKIEDLRLPTLNELMSALQYRKVVVFSYKKQVKEMMGRFFGEFKNDQGIYFFDEPVDLYIFRSGTRYIDNDSLPASLKYFIDALKDNMIIKDDDPKYISNIYCDQMLNKNIEDLKNTILIKLVLSPKKNMDFKNSSDVLNFYKELGGKNE